MGYFCDRGINVYSDCPAHHQLSIVSGSLDETDYEFEVGVVSGKILNLGFSDEVSINEHP